METTFNKRSSRLSAQTREIIMDIAVYLFIMLFMYTAASKLLTMEFFASTLAKLPVIGSFSLVIAWAIPIIEIMISIVLIVPPMRKIGIWSALILMIAFTLFLIYMVFSGNNLPCHCGGVISTMSWQQHIWFNIGFIALAFISLAANKK